LAALGPLVEAVEEFFDDGFGARDWCEGDCSGGGVCFWLPSGLECVLEVDGLVCVVDDLLCELFAVAAGGVVAAVGAWLVGWDFDAAFAPVYPVFGHVSDFAASESEAACEEEYEVCLEAVVGVECACGSEEAFVLYVVEGVFSGVSDGVSLGVAVAVGCLRHE